MEPDNPQRQFHAATIDGGSIVEAPSPKLSPKSGGDKLSGEKFSGTAFTARNTTNEHVDGEKEQKDEGKPAPPLSSASTARKLALLLMLTLSMFLDASNNSALFPAIPEIASELHFEASETVWIISAYQLTFAAFLLVSGRISDVYTPKPAFVAGAFILGLTHLVAGFTRHKIAVVVLRALGGIGGALTIPAALSLIVQLFPKPASQARAISVFSSAGAIGNVTGLFIGAVLVQYASWPWIFWFVAILGMGIAIVCLFLIPNAKRNKDLNVKFDVPGVSLLTIAVILFIFAVTSGSAQPWSTAYVLAPLIISISMIVAFFVWEARIPEDDAVLPPKMWRYRNFGVLVSIALLPYFWGLTSFVNTTPWWEQVYGWSAINTAVHFLPMGIGAWLVSNVTGRLPKLFPHKYILLGALGLVIAGTILFPFGDSPDTYWPFVFPAFCLGTVGCMILFANSSIAIFSYTPPEVAGTVGAVFNCAAQLGCAVGLAAVSSIVNSVDARTSLSPPVTEWSTQLDRISKDMWREGFKGRAAGYWFLLGILCLVAIAVLIFFKVDVPVYHEKEEESVQKVDAEASPSGKAVDFTQ